MAMPGTYLPLKDVSGFYLAPVPLEFPGKSGDSFVHRLSSMPSQCAVIRAQPVPEGGDMNAY